MTETFSAAQHFIECDFCENQPAKFLCKTCPGHLFDPCASEHEKKRMSRNHDIVFSTSDNEDLVDFLFCSSHSKKKLECYCEPCQKPVCTKCIGQTHQITIISKIYR